MGILPEISKEKAAKYDYFPTTWQAVIWRNWGYIPVERIASAIGTDCETVRSSAKLMGLNPDETVNSEWERRGYLTIIRNNWNLCTYEQIMQLLDISEKQLAFILKEDDFLWIKLGSMKPYVISPRFAPLNEAEKEETAKIARIVKRNLPKAKKREADFDFVLRYNKPLNKDEWEELKEIKTDSEHLRIVYPYFALYGDALANDDYDPLPERLLYEYSKAGINGIWIQALLYQLAEFPFDAEISKGFEKRLDALKRLCRKAQKFGIGIYLYFNEPRALGDAFFKKHENLRGQREGDFYALCTSTPEVREYLYNSMKTVFGSVPELAGFFTITMSENLTNCYSRLGNAEMICPRCKKRKPWEIVAEVNNVLAAGALASKPDTKIIAWSWGWNDAWADKVIDLLNENQIVQCTSEEALRYRIGGISGSVIDYTMSLTGPGEKAKSVWKYANNRGLDICAKVQLNNTWEMAAVPYIPVFDKIFEHIENLKNENVGNLLASWTLGGCPSINLELAEWLMCGKGNVQEFLEKKFGTEIGNVIFNAQRVFSRAFSNFPFYIGALYYGPQNYGPMAPFFLEKTGKRASMVGYPYDDIEYWSGIYPDEVYERQFAKLVRGWRRGVKILNNYRGVNNDADEIIIISEAILCHFESTLHHIKFVNIRNHSANTDIDARRKLLYILRSERKTVKRLIELRLKDSRIGYESSNHYFYGIQDLKEKLINLSYCERKIIDSE